MPTVDIRAGSGGFVAGNNTTIAAVYDGTFNWSSAFTGYDWARIGSNRDGSDYQANQSFFGWDTSTTNIPADATINSADIGLTATLDYGVHYAGDLIIEAFIFDWSAGGLTTADFRTHTQLTSLYSSPGLMASLDVSTISDQTAPASLPLVSESALVSSLNTSGTTYMVFVDQQHRTDAAYSAATSIQVAQASHATAAYRPTLTIDYTEGATAATYSGRGIARGIGRGIMRCLPTIDPWKRDPSGLLLPA